MILFLMVSLDWTVGAFYMNHEIENHIRGYRDNDDNPAIMYVCSEPFADPGYCYTHDFDDPFEFLEPILIL